ncbi:MAG: hypothetical protein P0116_13305 [Candidatus Nitrosocosmicus sp.]|nr:hypothetical protein [Candidatus Nitrosocosmicus sp.]
MLHSTDPENLRFCLCGCGNKIPSFDKKGRVRFYANGHNRRRPKIFPKYKGIARDLDREKLEEIIEILSSLLDRFMGANTTVSQLILVAQQEKFNKDLQEAYDQLYLKNLKNTLLVSTILPKYIKKDQMNEDDEQSIVEVMGTRARGTIVSEDRFDKLYETRQD